MNIMKGIFTAVTSIDSVTIYGVNAAAWAASLLNISDVVKLILLLASIVFTVVKTIDIVKSWVVVKDEPAKDEKEKEL
tara:strand:- start:8943 stop:9176 length:234 start_codon:yes stop_codon:yes gene_type:complete